MTFTFESNFFIDSHFDLSSTMNIKMRLVTQEDKNVLIEIMIKKWLKANFKNTSLWEHFRDDFEDWTEKDFKSKTKVSNNSLRRIRDVLWRRDVWILKNKKIIIAKSLYQTLQEEKSIEWTKEKIRRCMKSEQFIFNIIKNLIETNFDRNLKNYSWQTA